MEDAAAEILRRARAALVNYVQFKREQGAADLREVLYFVQGLDEETIALWEHGVPEEW